MLLQQKSWSGGKGSRLKEGRVDGFFKYERLPNFCYQCGMLDQREKDCLEKMNMGKVKDVCNMERGLEVSQVDEGEEIKEEQEKRIGRKSNQAGRRWWRKRLHKKSSG